MSKFSLDVMQKHVFPFADIGRVTDGVGMYLLREDEAIHYREIRCEEDELARMWALYPRDG